MKGEEVYVPAPLCSRRR